MSGDTITITVSPIWVSLTWKVQLLMRGWWRPKDVYDIYQMIQTDEIKHIDKTLFRDCLLRLMTYRGVDHSKLELFRDSRFGKSKSARHKWKRWQIETHPQHDHVNMDATWAAIFEWMKLNFFAVTV